MAISAAALEGAIKTALNDYNNGAYKNETDNPLHLKVMGEAMKGYFEKNIDIIYAWSAVLPPPASTPDPVVSFKSIVTFSSFDLTASRGLDDMALYIAHSFATATIKHASGFTVTPGSFFVSLAPPLGKITDQKMADKAILLCIAIPVCAWVLTLINPAALAGTHAAYTGATTGMVIA